MRSSRAAARNSRGLRLKAERDPGSAAECNWRVYTAGSGYGLYAVARIDGGTGQLAPGTTEAPWGHGDVTAPSSSPVGWVAFTPGGGTVTATSMAVYDGSIFVTGSAVGGTYDRAGFAVISLMNGEASNIGSLSPRDENNFGGYLANVTGGDIFVVGGKVYVFGPGGASPPLNDIVWVGERDLNGDNTFAFGDVCPGQPPTCRTGFATRITSYNFIKYGDTDILDGVAYTVSRAWTSQSEGRILVTIADLNSPSSATVDVLFDVGGSLFTPKAIKVQDDGKILIGGFIDTGTDPIMFLLRFNSDGTSDGTTFALPASGDLSPDGIDQINDIGLFSDGRIAVVGRSGDGAFSARFLADGTLDTSYSTDGYHVYLPSSGSAEFHELAAGQRVRAVGAVNGDVLIADYQ